MPKPHQSKTDQGDILIVDDETANLKMLKELLNLEGYQVRPTGHPQLAIDSALAQPPALILLDVKMPEMDGFEVCKRLKQDDRTRYIPIIFISALQDAQDKVKGFEAGGVDFISKPFQEEEVLARAIGLRPTDEALLASRAAALNAEHPGYLEAVLDEVHRRGPLTVGDLSDPDATVFQLVEERGGVPLMPEQGTKPVNRYLPPREKGGIDVLAPLLTPVADEPRGLLRWIDKALEKLP